MDTMKLGATNLEVSRIAFGGMGIGSPSWRSWVRDEHQSRAIIERALELGMFTFDTCDYYSAGEGEKVLGAHLHELIGREEVVIATKFGNPVSPGPNGRGYSRKHVMAAVDDSLRRLGTDYIDLYQTHIWCEPVRVEEVIEALHDLVVSGKVRYVGVADMPTWRVAEFVYKARAMGLREIVSVQHHYNLVWRGNERELIPFCEHESLGMLSYSPLARGFLAHPSGHDRDTERARTDELSRTSYGRQADHDVAAALQQVAGTRGISMAAVALAWVLARNPRATPLIGATTVTQLTAVEEALACTLSPEELAQLEQPYQPRMRYGH
jgi:aryl-alcohol dehydrogenase (NADP+)